jgi:hypothetical protein
MRGAEEDADADGDARNAQTAWACSSASMEQYLITVGERRTIQTICLPGWGNSNNSVLKNCMAEFGSSDSYPVGWGLVGQQASTPNTNGFLLCNLV